MRDVLVHDAPQPLDRVQVRAIGWNEMQPDPEAGPGKPRSCTELGVMIVRVVKQKKTWDQRHKKASIHSKSLIVVILVHRPI